MTPNRVLAGMIAVVAGLNVWGFPYYVLDMSERVRSPMHAGFRPSGYVGQSVGIAAFLLFAFLWMYPVRKRVRKLAFTGSVSRWLSWHLVAGLTVPFLVAVHAGWRFQGLAGLSFTAMVLVWMSGIVGRYLYVRIPRGRDGLVLSLEEIRAERERLAMEIRAVVGDRAGALDTLLAPGRPEAPGLGTTIRRFVADDLARRRAVREVRRRLRASQEGAALDRRAAARVLGLARRQIALEQQVRLLTATQKVFRFWHAAHQPVAVTALLGVLVHVITVIVVGATWFR
jgi:hypothetical protein